MGYANVGDVQVRYSEGTFSGQQDSWVETLIGDAEAILNARIPSLAADVASGDVDPAVARFVVVSAVLRVVRNPSGVKQQSVGPFSVSTDTGPNTNTGIWFRDDELSLLAASTPLTVGSAQLGIPRWLQP